MVNIDREVLSRAAVEIIHSNNYKGFRCHEMARVLRYGLYERGHQNVQVRDGIAVYSRDLFLSDSNTEINEEIIGSVGKQTAVYHSWCELGDWTVDYNPHLRLTSHLAVEMLVVDNREDLADRVRYSYCGRELRLLNMGFLFIAPKFFTHLGYVA